MPKKKRKVVYRESTKSVLGGENTCYDRRKRRYVKKGF